MSGPQNEHTDRDGYSLYIGILQLAVAVMMRDPSPGGSLSGSGVRQERDPAPGGVHWPGSEDGGPSATGNH